MDVEAAKMIGAGLAVIVTGFSGAFSVFSFYRS